MLKQQIVVTGAGGQLGQTLRVLAVSEKEYDFVFLDRQQLPIENFEAIKKYFESVRPAFCINCAAYTAVDRAEQEKELAFLINADAVAWLASACHQSGTRLIHISTDYVFDGRSGAALKETDPTTPLNQYGASKLKGEQALMKNNPESIILRTSWLYSEFGNNFVKTMVRLMREKTSISVVDDQVGSPTYAADLGRVILQIIHSGKFIPGIYHYSNEGKVSWYQFALAIKEGIHSQCKVNPIPSSGYPTPAKRPSFSLLDKTKIKEVYQIEIPGWQTSLGICIKNLLNR